jgi:hypothetical protein
VKLVKVPILFFLFSALISFAQEIGDNPLRMVGTNIFDFNPLIQSFRFQQITNSAFLVFGRVAEVNNDVVIIVHNERRNQLTEEFSRQMLSSGSGGMLKMAYATSLLEKWRAGQLSAGEFLSIDPDMREIVLDEIQREKEDFVEIAVVVKNVPANYLAQGKQVRFLAFPLAAKTINAQSQYDYGRLVLGNRESFTNKYFVTTQGYIKQRMPKKDLVKTNELVVVHTNLPAKN